MTLALPPSDRPPGAVRRVRAGRYGGPVMRRFEGPGISPQSRETHRDLERLTRWGKLYTVGSSCRALGW